MSEKTPEHSLLDEPFRFDFFQAVRLLEKIFPERAPVARSVTPQNEIVRFRSYVSMGFPASEIQKIEENADEISDDKKLEMFVNFMGMVGMVGSLPGHYTELIVERARYGDTALHYFLDIFTHRSISVFYRAWEKYRFPVQYERGNDDFTSFLFDLAGLGTNELRGRMNLRDESLLPYTGLIMQKPHSVAALEQMISDYFGVKAKILQFSGQWLSLDDENITRLGKTNNSLGSTALVGTRVWDYGSKFRIVLGALKFAEFQDFLPTGSAYKSLISIVNFMVGEAVDFDVSLKLKAKEVPGTILTTRAKRRPMLGWTSFLKTKPFTEDDEQVILQTDSGA